jgi:hypothetical protein
MTFRTNLFTQIKERLNKILEAADKPEITITVKITLFSSKTGKN